jgi:hypothetical protein
MVAQLNARDSGLGRGWGRLGRLRRTCRYLWVGRRWLDLAGLHLPVIRPRQW